MYISRDVVMHTYVMHDLCSMHNLCAWARIAFTCLYVGLPLSRHCAAMQVTL